ncbi:MAG: PadR family transcriptional regulator [Clostridia bacterium]|jgi:PadR family transcriptional regulator, regulatory protein PadR|nr:PadR family transcriptional regulator [Clostridia bacterium]NLS84237.1 PadR family transcriptional regulator [Oscillospiraceae bacterium]
MAFNTGSALLDALVLSVVSDESTYGYKITQDVRAVMDVSESTLYPVLRRLQKNGSLDTYDREFAGRNRRYYSITPDGCKQLEQYRNDWRDYQKKIDKVLFGGDSK